VDGACCPRSTATTRSPPTAPPLRLRMAPRTAPRYMDSSTPLLSTMGTPCDEGWKAQGVAVLCLCALSFMACAPVELPGALAGTHNDSISQGRTQVYADRPFCAAVGPTWMARRRCSQRWALPSDDGWKAQGLAVVRLCALSSLACAPVELPGALAGTRNHSISARAHTDEHCVCCCGRSSFNLVASRVAQGAA